MFSSKRKQRAILLSSHLNVLRQSVPQFFLMLRSRCRPSSHRLLKVVHPDPGLRSTASHLVRTLCQIPRAFLSYKLEISTCLAPIKPMIAGKEFTVTIYKIGSRDCQPGDLAWQQLWLTDMPSENSLHERKNTQFGHLRTFCPLGVTETEGMTKARELIKPTWSVKAVGGKGSKAWSYSTSCLLHLQAQIHVEPVYLQFL